MLIITCNLAEVALKMMLLPAKMALLHDKMVICWWIACKWCKLLVIAANSWVIACKVDEFRW